jgi:CBS domain-containing protein
MPKTIDEVMTRSLRTVDAGTSVQDAARTMREADIGDVIVTQGDTLCGIVTDRDITVRAVAEGRDAASLPVGDICSKEVATLSRHDTVDDAVRLMRERAIRRLAVVDGGKPVGIVSIGDLAIELDSRSALADISAAEGNR